MEIGGKIDENQFSHPRSQGLLVSQYGRRRPGDMVAIFQRNVFKWRHIRHISVTKQAVVTL